MKRLILSDLTWFEARTLFYHLVRWSQHSPLYWRALPDNFLCIELDKINYDYRSVINMLQKNFTQVIPEFENMLSLGNFRLETTSESGDTTSSFFHFAEHMSIFDASNAAREASIKNASVQDIYTAIAKGFSSIDYFMNEKAKAYNDYHKEEVLTDNIKRRVNLEKKLDEWLPTLTEFFTGKRFILNPKRGTWYENSDFAFLKTLGMTQTNIPK